MQRWPQQLRLLLLLLLRWSFSLCVVGICSFAATTTAAARASSWSPPTPTTRSGGGSSSSSSLPAAFPLAGISRDPFVEASPLVIGVVCSDGIVLMAFHSIFSEGDKNNDNASESELLVRPVPPRDDSAEKNNKNSGGNAFGFRDLPMGYRGPFRIHPLSPTVSTTACAAPSVSALVCAGWRTDGHLLAEHLRSVDRRERRLFGERNGSRSPSFLAESASSFLARSTVSEQRRSLVCAGLLATAAGGNGGTTRASSAALWLVDGSGAYRVRAHALGRGSEAANAVLRKRSDWNELDSETVRTELLSSLSAAGGSGPGNAGDEEKDETNEGSSPSPKNDDDDDDDTKRSTEELPQESSCVEVVAIDAAGDSSTNRAQRGKPMKRLFCAPV